MQYPYYHPTTTLHQSTHYRYSAIKSRRPYLRAAACNGSHLSLEWPRDVEYTGAKGKRESLPRNIHLHVARFSVPYFSPPFFLGCLEPRVCNSSCIYSAARVKGAFTAGVQTPGFRFLAAPLPLFRIIASSMSRRYLRVALFNAT